MQGGDDLEDDFIFDAPDIVASDTDDDIPNIPLVDEEDTFVTENPVAARATENLSLPPSPEKKRKRREKEKEKKEKKRKLAQDNNNSLIHHGPAKTSPEQISAYLSQIQRKVFSSLTEMELDDMQIPASSIVDTTSFTSPRTADSLPDFILQILPNLAKRIAQKPKRNGAPTVLVLAGAALRVTDLTRVMRPMKGDKGGDIAKLFAKHFKLAEHVTYLQKTKIGVGIGTPDRIGKLLSSQDALQTSALTHIILDVSHQDSKKRTLLDIPETRKELFEGVFQSKPTEDETILELVRLGKIQLVLF